MCRIEAKLDRGSDLVDILSARAAGPDKTLFDFILVDRDAVGEPDHSPEAVSALDADQRLERCNLARETREMRRLDHSRAVLVGPGRLFGDAAHRRALDNNAAPAQLVHHLSAMPQLECLMPAQTPAGAVAGGGECSLRPLR